MPPPASPLRAVLFDLDGTLLDTAPDMLAALRQLAEENQHPCHIEYHRHKALVTRGAQSLIEAVFGRLDPKKLEQLRQRYLQIYQHRLTATTCLFDGIDTLLENLQQRGIPWGIVTNKPGWLSKPLTHAIPILRQSAVLVSGDNVPRNKPDPMPLQHALTRLNVHAAHSLYLGDAHTDALAANAAGMHAGVALWGYLQPGDNPNTWHAEVFSHPRDVARWIEKHLTRTVSADPTKKH